ncbi:MAG TPA: NAD(P)H-hydrate epimerase, partial [Candidatus Thermoplasmatota archaeon]|nr:NAD(P)H-hydrate epimerase [Candidatus Thermoplasmatota archaeon]
MLTAAQARRLDLNSAALGIPVTQLMLNAGAALAREVRKEAAGGPILFLCGKGHNGGDGLAAAAVLARAGHTVRVALAERPEALAPACRPLVAQLEAAFVLPWDAKVRAALAAQRWAVVVDCLLGTGASGPPRPPYGEMLALLRSARRGGATVVACDVPSVLGTSHAVRPDATVTFHAPKLGMTARNSGRIVVADIGIPREAEEGIGPGDLDAGYVRPRRDSHKGQNGVVLVVGGGPYTGAPHYAGMAAYRTGADLVHAVVPRPAAATVAGYGPEILVHACDGEGELGPEGAGLAQGLLDRATAAVVGPGLGPGLLARSAARQVIEAAAQAGVPVVVDADGLDALDAALLRRHGRSLVLTPHAREFQDLAGAATSVSWDLRTTVTPCRLAYARTAASLAAAPARSWNSRACGVSTRLRPCLRSKAASRASRPSASTTTG